MNILEITLKNKDTYPAFMAIVTCEVFPVCQQLRFVWGISQTQHRTIPPSREGSFYLG